MDANLDTHFIDYLASATGLPRSTCERIALDVLAEFDETLEDFVQRRHGELRATTDLKNEQIYERIRAEIPTRRFTIPDISKRQVRRYIYG